MRRILVIDDDAGVRTMLAEVLKQPGSEVVLAGDGREALELIRKQPVDVVITDLFMPHKEGLETIREIHEGWPQVGIIAISGKPGASEMLSVAQRLGASRIVRKPFAPQEILTAVEETIKQKS